MNPADSLRSSLHNYYKKLEEKSHLLNYLFLEITRKCNLNCLHCGSDCKNDAQAPELTTESWFKIIDYIKEAFSEKVSFIITGGEPLMHPDLYKIGSHISKNNMKWGMVTNGMTLDQNAMESLIKSGINSITISVDGNETAHNKLRNSPAAFKKMSLALDYIADSGLEYRDAVTCVYPGNLNQLDEIAEFLIVKKMPAWRLFRIFPSGRAHENDEILLSFEQTQELVDWIKTNKKKYAKKGLKINLSCEGWMPFNIDKQVRDNPFFCRAGINFASILCDGTITGCSNNHHTFYQGNILTDNMNSVWEHKFEDFRKREWLKNTVCNDCKEVKNCKGGSIHLWDLERDRPNFCYYRDLGDE
ncbi:MAG: hypothetical protein A2W91_11570 [Bacteroidetes bacterium GWF2_38_335]|nr:MAG: hypothetical protein A2W91_11570 [Bacteroidetes bacterium GWF2_38_335]OFY77918.1 MAG: hypothetical protein A2281_18315 [Bacteroidetes bacterium RIFOXYA12_FULL_38_20]HBS86658.1 radical SAM/SPASM domain-containing protein [Bacteroidales bacterium]